MPHTLFDVDRPTEATTAGRGSAGPRRRDAIAPVRLTKGERDQLAEVARHLGISLSTYLRQAALSRPLPLRRAVRPIPEVNRETYHALGRLAADVNGMARHMAERRQPVEHVSPSLPRDERPLSNDDMAKLAEEYLRRRRYDPDRVQYVVVQHHDKGHQHCTSSSIGSARTGRSSPSSTASTSAARRCVGRSSGSSVYDPCGTSGLGSASGRRRGPRTAWHAIGVSYLRRSSSKLSSVRPRRTRRPWASSCESRRPADRVVEGR